MARAMGVGGVFLRARDPKALSAWYAQHFGIGTADETSIVFDGPGAAGMTVFAHFPADTQYFGTGPQQAMINLRVDNAGRATGAACRRGCRDRAEARKPSLWAFRVDRRSRRQSRRTVGAVSHPN